MPTFHLDSGISLAQGGRKYQEDSFALWENDFKKDGHALYCVFDGHGGAYFSSHASQHMTQFLVQSLSFKQGDYKEAIKKAFNEEDEALKDVHKKHPSGGTTATIALIANGELFVGNVGDSRCIVGRKQIGQSIFENTAIQCTKDHSFGNSEEQRRILDSGGIIEGGRVISQGHGINMTRALGDFEFKRPINQAKDNWISAVPDIYQLTLRPENEFLILATDGLWNVWSDNAVVSKVAELQKEGKSAQQVSEIITMQISQERWSDNITIMVVFFLWETDQSGIHTTTESVKLTC